MKDNLEPIDRIQPRWITGCQGTLAGRPTAITTPFRMVSQAIVDCRAGTPGLPADSAMADG